MADEYSAPNQYLFLAGGGEMGQLMRTIDWSGTPVGIPSGWPQSLRTTLSIILNSKFPMFLFWGPEQVCFYNDAYRPSLGQEGKHPESLGKKGVDVWPEIWPDIYPLIQQVLNGGEATWAEDQLLPIYRNGSLEDVYWTFSYSPVTDEEGKVAGVFVTCSETTDKINNYNKLQESRNQLQFAIESAELGTWDYEPATNKFTANNRLKDWFGLPHTSELVLDAAINVIAPKDRQRVQDAIQHALQYSSGGHYDIEYSIMNPFSNKEIIVDVKGRAWFNEDKAAYRFNGTMQDVTEQVMARKKVEESEERFRSMAESSEIMIALSDETGNAIYFNQAWAKLTGRPVEELEKFGWSDLIHEEDKSFTDIYLDAFEKRLPWAAQYRILNKDGGYSYLLGQGRPRLRPDGTFAGYISSCINNTQQQDALKKLAESEERFRHTVQQAPLGITILRGKDFFVEMANPTYLKIVNREESGFVGKPLFETWPQVRESIEKILNDVLTTGIAYHGIEFPVYVKHEGTDILTYFNFVYQPLIENDGQTGGIIVVASDVTASVKAKHALAESEREFRNMVMQSPIPMTILRGRDYIIETANLAMIQKVWRKKEADVIGHSILKVFPELLDQKYPELLNLVYTSGQMHTETESIAYVEGDDGMKKFYLDFEYAPLLEPDQTVSGIIITVNNVTEKVEARLKVEQSEQRLNLVIDASELGTWEWNIQTDEMKYSERFARIFGFEENSKFEHGQFLKRLHPDDIPVRTEAFKKAYQNGILQYESRVLWPNGTQRWMQVKGKVFKNPHGEPVSLIGTARDTTDEKYQQQELEDRERKFRLLADSMPQMVWTGNAYGELNYFNQSVYSYSGLSKEKIAENGWLQIVHPDDQEENIKAWNHAVETGTDFIFEHRFRRADGQYRWQLSRAIPQKDVLDNIRMWVGTSTDIQEIKELDEQKDLFIGIASHELKTPITTVKGYVQLLQDTYTDMDDPFLKHSLDRMHKQIITLTDLISDLLDLSKIKSGSLYFNKENLDLTELADEIINNIKDIYPSHQIDFIKNGKAMLYADKNRIAQVIINFLTNAIKYSPDSKLIKVAVETDHTNSTLSVTDEGIGIGKSDQEKIFQRFYRVEGKNEKTFPGFGIGLFISSEIVKKHSGNIGVSSEQGQGSTFYFTLPLLNS